MSGTPPSSRLPTFRVVEAAAFRLGMRTRFPFRYGIASMTELPHLVLRIRLESALGETTGIAAEGLPPKWFTKNPATTFEDDDLPGMLGAISAAVGNALRLGTGPGLGFFDFWRDLLDAQSEWARDRHVPPLLAQLGTALVERAVLDALCRGSGIPLAEAVLTGALPLDLGSIHPELAGLAPSALLPRSPRTTLEIRHTVGLGDPLTIGDSEGIDPPEDGLPLTLEENIRAYGLRWFKIKLCGEIERDEDRLGSIARLLALEAPPDWWVTLDGNEQFESAAAFREAWDALAADPATAPLIARTAVIEQPIHRDRAMATRIDEISSSAGSPLPPVIIDESDGAIDSLPRALELGYRGTSHKNCKGIVKGIANACLLAKRRSDGCRESVMTAEDLANIGPVALLQDLAVVAMLGIPHAERNGHHYFKGLSMWPSSIQEAAIHAHRDLYRPHTDTDGRVSFPVLAIDDGTISLDSVNRAPFGFGPLLETTALEHWPEALADE